MVPVARSGNREISRFPQKSAFPKAIQFAGWQIARPNMKNARGVRSPPGQPTTAPRNSETSRRASGGHSGVIRGSCGGHLRIIRGSFRGSFWGPFWDHLGIPIGPPLNGTGPYDHMIVWSYMIIESYDHAVIRSYDHVVVRSYDHMII